MNIKSSTGGIAKLLYEEALMKMVSDFSNWRIDPFIRQMEAKKQKGRIFPFVRGLRLSANLIYAIRDILSGTNLTADWGHLLDQSGKFCSCECDVIIHHKGYIRQWNGTKKPIMDFRFIEQQKAVAVISCKSYLRTGDIDKRYCELMKPFVKKVWLFAECCSPGSVKNIQQKAKNLGYKKFWHIYTWNRQTQPKPNKKGWNEFVREVKKLVKQNV